MSRKAHFLFIIWYNTTMNTQLNFTTNTIERQLFLPMDLAKIIPTNDSVRLLSNILEGLNYSKLMQEYSHFGRSPKVKPKVMFKILVYAFMNNIYSSRQIEKYCYRDINFMWLLEGTSPPDHNTISRFRSTRLANCMEDLFYQLIIKLSQLGEIDFSNLFVDGTKIEANANKYTFVWKKSTQKHEIKLDEKINNLILTFNKDFNTQFTDITQIKTYVTKIIKKNNVKFVQGKGKRKTELQKIYETLNEYNNRKIKYQNYNSIFKDRNSFSKTDEDATFMHLKEDHMRNSQLKPAYNVQIGVSGEYVIGTEIFDKRTDYYTLIPFLETLKKYLPKFKNIVADAGYESEENYEYLENNNQTSYIKPKTYEKQKTRKFKNDISKRENMEYLNERDEYICHNGRKLKYSHLQKRRTTSGYISNVSVYECENCSNCELKSKCTKSKHNKKITVSKQFIKLRNKSYENITSNLGIYLRVNRSIQVEGAFGVLKQNHKYRQFLLRGMDKVKIEFLILCMAYNIKKLHSKIESKRLGVAFHQKSIS